MFRRPISCTSRPEARTQEEKQLKVPFKSISAGRRRRRLEKGSRRGRCSLAPWPPASPCWRPADPPAIRRRAPPPPAPVRPAAAPAPVRPAAAPPAVQGRRRPEPSPTGLRSRLASSSPTRAPSPSARLWDRAQRRLLLRQQRSRRGARPPDQGHHVQHRPDPVDRGQLRQQLRVQGRAWPSSMITTPALRPRAPS